MSILNVNKINPVGGGSTITIAGIASVTNNISVGNSVTANSFHGDGANLTGLTPSAITSIGSDGANRVLTSDGDGTATAHSFVTIESSRLSVNRGSGSGAFPLIVRRTDASGIIAEFANSSGYGLLIGQNSATGEAYLRTGTGQPMVFTTNAGSGIANERMRITSGGALCVNRAADPLVSDVKLMAQNDGGNVGMFYHGGTGNNYTLLLRNDRGSGSTQATQIIFLTSGNTFVGDIRSTGSSTAYNTSSDYRLKENVTPISDGITRLKTLKPSRFNFKVDKDTTVDGFLAHEVTAVPEAVSGTKDEVDSDNNPVYQGIDQAKLVPLLTAALQEAITKIEKLEADVAALKGS